MRLLLVLSGLLLGGTAPAHATGDRLVDGYPSVYGTPGVAAAVIDDGSAVTPRTPFRIASLSKSMTATAIMLLTDRLSVDDPVVKVLPEIPDSPRARSSRPHKTRSS